MPSVKDKGGNQSYFQYDGLGSTTDLTDGGANVTASYGYDVFGALRSGSPGANSFLFTGEQRDAGLGSPAMGLYYLRARYYDPAIGRFLGQDPVPANNLYAYVGNNPVNLVDPYGLFSFDDVKKGLSNVVKTAVDAACSNIQTMVACGMAGVGPLGDSYFDVNVTFGCYLVYSFGMQYSADQGFHPYYGAGGGSCGAAVSSTVGYNQDITPGRNCGFQGTVLPGVLGPTAQGGLAQVDIDKEGNLNFDRAKGFGEVGVAVGFPSGFSFAGTCIMVGSMGPLSW